ncbi:class I SAM-dependent methyltransferase, partial [bacterium]|nr:class I SAM-dependent methyltransferase [bacterium]
MVGMASEAVSTQSLEYARFLAREPFWRRFLGVQLPYRWNIRRLNLGFVLDVGAGAGRNLMHLRGNGIGVEPNPHSVFEMRARGLTAYTVEEFFASSYAKKGCFDSLLLSHVLEHLAPMDAVALLKRYAPFVRPGGKVVIITPQAKGYASDPTHLCYVDR